MNGQLTKGGRTMPVSTMLRSSLLRGTLAVSLALPLLGVGALRAAEVIAAPATVPAAMRVVAAPTVVRAPMAALPTNAACTAGASDTTCDIWAKAGTATIAPSTSVTVWSFVDSAGASVTAPVGPTLVVTEGQTVHLTLHNELATGFTPDALSLSLPQVDNFPDDFSGVALHGTKTYDFVAARPGTFLYQAGGTKDGAREAAMGLVGALVVVPSNDATTGYGTNASHFDDESVIVVSDVDPGLNANPGTYDMRGFAPHFRLYNGTSYPATPDIPVNAGGTTLLRIVNAGVIQHAIGVLGAPVTLFAQSSRPVPVPFGIAAENVPAGDTMDLLVGIPVTEGLKYAVYDPSMRLDNDGAASSTATGNIVSFGGGLTFLQASGTPPVVNSAPVVSALSVTPTIIGPTPTNVSFNATITDDTQVIGAEYVIDDASVPTGSGNPVAVSPAASVSLTNIPVTLPATIATGTHQLLVRGQDVNGWGALQSVSFKVDKAGPTVTGITTASPAVNGSAALPFTGIATDVGGSSVTGVQWSLDGGAAAPATLSPVAGAPSVSFSGSVAAGVLTGLTDGLHYLSAVGTDALGNTGDPGPPGTPVGTAFIVDRTAPTTGPVTITPNPNDGSQGVSYDPTSVEVRSPYSDAGSGVASGELFLNAAGAPGTGAMMTANAPTTSLVGLIPLSQLNGLTGNIPIWVRAKDKAGNWSTAVQGTLTINRTITVSGLTVTPATTATAGTVALAGTATASAGQTVGGAEYYIDTAVPAGSGTAMTVGPLGQSAPVTASVPIGGLSVGTHTIGVRARTSLGTWGPVTTVTLTLNKLFTDGFETGALPSPWASVTGTATRTAAAAQGPSSTNGLSVTVTSTSSRGYVTTPTITPAVGGYHVQFRLDQNTLTTQNRWVSVFQGMGGNTERFRVEYRRNGTGNAQVRLVVATGGGGGTSTVPATGQVNLTAGSNVIGVDWTSAASASVTLRVNGVPTTRTGLNTNNRTVTAGRLGISIAPGAAPTGSSGNYTGVLYLDAFDSARYAF